MAITLRTATAADRIAIVEVERAAFGRDDEAELVARIWALPEYLPHLDLVAVDDGDAVVGHVLHSIGYVRRDDARHDVVALAPLAVAPAHQRRGIGGALVHEAIERASRAGYAAIVLTGHPTYYPRFGFVPARSVGIAPNKDLPADPDPFLVRLLGAYDAEIRGVFRYCWE
jgi:predicted N-acetyltransferase YhbS